MNIQIKKVNTVNEFSDFIRMKMRDMVILSVEAMTQDFADNAFEKLQAVFKLKQIKLVAGDFMLMQASTSLDNVNNVCYGFKHCDTRDYLYLIVKDAEIVVVVPVIKGTPFKQGDFWK